MNERLLLSRKKKNSWSFSLFIIPYHLHFLEVSEGQVIVKAFWTILNGRGCFGGFFLSFVLGWVFFAAKSLGFMLTGVVNEDVWLQVMF